MSIRWRARVKKKWLVEDQKDMSWMEPMLEYRKEKALNESKETEPSQLHVVCRVQPLKGRPWWEKKIMERLGLDGPVSCQFLLKQELQGRTSSTYLILCCGDSFKIVKNHMCILLGL